MKYVSLLLITIFFFANSNLKAQESKHEVGVQMSNLSNFVLLYKKERKENTYTVFNASRTGSGSFWGYNGGSISSSVNLSIGNEKRKAITDNLSFIRGIGASISAGNAGENNVFRELYYQGTVTTRLFYKLGLNLEVNEQWNISLECRPGFSIKSHFYGDKPVQYRASFSSDQSALRLGVTYSFSKSKVFSKKDRKQ